MITKVGFVLFLCIFGLFLVFGSGSAPQIYHRCAQDLNCNQANVNTTCQDHICRCKANHADTGNPAGRCYPPKRLGENCAVDLECLAGNFGTVCAANKTCQCKPGYKKTADGKCIGDRTPNGAPCQTDQQCILVDFNSKCSSLFCICKDGYKLTGSHCEMIPSALNDHCFENEQCQLYDPHSMCYDAKCICGPGFDFQKSDSGYFYCYAKKSSQRLVFKHNSLCVTSHQCRKWDKHSRCSHKHCICPQGYNVTEEKCNGCSSLFNSIRIQYVVAFVSIVFIAMEKFTKNEMA